jgi:hypothetical protein
VINVALQYNGKGFSILREFVFSRGNVLRVYESKVEGFVEN